MRFLLFSDLHCDVDAARRLVERSRDVDVVIGAGDFANMRRQVHVCMDVLQAMHCPAVLVPGNNESLEELTAACKTWPGVHVLHGSGIVIQDVAFFGLGGGVPVTPFGDWSFDLTEEHAAKLLADCPCGGVLVSHSPPRGAVDISSRGQSLGSTAVRDCILDREPRLVVCGHIHACAGQNALLGATPVVNAGPGGIEWDLPS